MDIKSYVTAVGAANVDVHGRSKNTIVMRDSNPGHLRTSAGGVTRNVAENLARQGVGVKLLTAVGDDVYGEKILRDSQGAGIDVSGVARIAGASSSCYIAVLDERGDMLIGMSDMSILSHVTPAYLDGKRDVLLGAAAIVCDPCLPIPIVEYLASLGVPVFLDPVSTAYSRAVEPIVGSLFCVKPNRLELSVLAGTETDSDDGVVRAADALLARGVSRVAVSLGERGCYWADSDGRRMFRALRPIPVMENATGAGDAFMSGLVHGYVGGMGAEETVDYALACGVIAICSEDTISRDMSDAAVRRAMREYAI